MSEAFLGIDLGTSSVKVVFVKDGRTVERSSAAYRTKDPEGWISAVRKALSGLTGREEACAAGLSSQTGTYIVNDRYVLPWNGKEGFQELQDIRKRFSTEEFLREIGMDHPELTSYPLPKLLYAGRYFGELKSFYQPKDYLCQKLTGNRVSDPCTWRGLADIRKGEYSSFLLDEMGIAEEILPELYKPQEAAGMVTAQASQETGLREGIPVYTGLNDYFAALLGMGVVNTGDWFDITGTSEHVGCIEDVLKPDTGLISGPYLQGFVHYGVTASTGAALDFGRNIFPQELKWENLTEERIRRAPVFRPYLAGRRSPDPDPEAAGAFVGIREGCLGEDMAYAVLEGVAFSLYHIYETVLKKPVQSGMPGPERGSGISCAGKTGDSECTPGPGGSTGIRVCGGAAVNPVLNHLKAELFGRELWLMEEKDASAFGAALTAMLGEGAVGELSEIPAMCRISKEVKPEERLRQVLLERYRIFRNG